VNKRLSHEFQAAYKEGTQSCKLLLLGAGDSGKTTWRKQICNLYNHVYATTATRAEVIPVIVENIVHGLKAMLVFIRDGDLRDEPSDVSLEHIAQLDDKLMLTAESAALINRFWQSAVAQKAFARKNQFQLQDCFAYFVQQLARYPEWGGSKWVPTEEECVRARVRTSGIIEESFLYKNVTFRLYDAGGQRAERRKWIHCFDGVTAVIFVAATSEYDQALFEDAKVNRLQEGLSLFADTCNSKWFTTTPILLFLNKVDLFREKFGARKVPLNVSGLFPTAPGVDVSCDTALKWMSELFLEKRSDREKPVFVHFTTATDKGNAQAVFQDCALIILAQSLEQSGFSP